jgi:hypothetical protein
MDTESGEMDAVSCSTLITGATNAWHWAVFWFLK